MAKQTIPYYPLEKPVLNALVEDAVDFAICHGMVMRKENIVRAAPFTLLPSPVPKALFEKVYKLAPAFQKLKHDVVNDVDFLKSTLKTTSEQDEFTARLLKLLEDSEKKGIRQNKTLMITRCDYMLHQPKQSDPIQLQQVEMNMISCSFSNLGSRAAQLHKYLIEKHNSINQHYKSSNLVENTAGENVVASLAEAFNAYGVSNAIIVMIVQPGEKNAFDQRFFDYWLANHRNIKMMRYTMKQIDELAEIDEDGRMKINNEEIAVAYFRAGYTPRDYPSESEWNGRLKLETSLPIKCPTVAIQLSGLKKVQQVLAQDDVMKRFVPDEQLRSEMTSLYAGLWSLGDGTDEELVKKAIAEECATFVLKPQREGGGNNFYGKEATEKLKTMTVEQRRAFILMSRIVHPTHDCYVVRDTADGVVTETGAVVSELGIFGSLLADGDKVIHNRSEGYLLRTKAARHNDGGVAAGVAVLDSLYLK